MMLSLNWIKTGWIGFLVILFAGFCVWYGGNGKPISAEEGADLLAQMRAAYDTPTSEGHGLADNLEAMIPNDDGKEFYAVNLERLKSGDAAKAADVAYTRIVFPLLLKRASHPVFVSQRAGLMLGAYGEQVDRVAVVRYRSLRDMMTMTLEPSMIDGGHHKFAALEHTEVFITRPMISFMHIRLMLGLILLILGFLGLRGIDLISKHIRKAEG